MSLMSVVRSTPAPVAPFPQSQVADNHLRRLNDALNATPKAVRQRVIVEKALVHPSQLLEEVSADISRKRLRDEEVEEDNETSVKRARSSVSVERGQRDVPVASS